MSLFRYLVILSFCLQSLSTAATYYVSPDGNDSHSGSAEAPLQRINTALNRTSPGDTVLVHGGTYTNMVNIPHSGEPGKRIVLKNVPGEIPILNGWQGESFANSPGIKVADKTVGHFEVEGFYITGFHWGCIGGGFDGTCADKLVEGPAPECDNHGDIVMRHNICDVGGTLGFAAFMAHDVLMERNLANRTGSQPPSWSSGFNLYGLNGENNIVRQNVSFQNVDVSSHKTDGNGFILDLSYDHGGVTFASNIAFLNGGGGINITKSGNAKVIANTAWGNGVDPEEVPKGQLTMSNSSYCVAGTEVKGNLFAEYQTIPTVDNKAGEWMNETAFENNYLYGTIRMGGNETEGDGEDPFFRNTNSGDFRLTESSAAAYGARVSDMPEYDNGFDPACLKPLDEYDDDLIPQSREKMFSWWAVEPDYAEIMRRGEISLCWNPKRRVSGSFGAYDSEAIPVGVQQKPTSVSASIEDRWRLKVSPQEGLILIHKSGVTRKLDGSVWSD